jgi:hypothetical protein
MVDVTLKGDDCILSMELLSLAFANPNTFIVPVFVAEYVHRNSTVPKEAITLLAGIGPLSNVAAPVMEVKGLLEFGTTLTAVAWPVFVTCSLTVNIWSLLINAGAVISEMRFAGVCIVRTGTGTGFDIAVVVTFVLASYPVAKVLK